MARKPKADAEPDAPAPARKQRAKRNRRPRAAPEGGRPTLCTDEVQERFVKLILEGVKPRSRICLLCDVGTRTYQTWMSSDAPRHRQFQRAILRAEAERIEDLCRKHHDLTEPANNPNPANRARVIEWELAQDPEYSPRARIEATGAGGGPVQVEHSGAIAVEPRISPERLAQLPLEQLEAALEAAQRGEAPALTVGDDNTSESEGGEG